MESRKYYFHITGLKGIACVLIMVCHFLGLYKHAQQFVPGIPLLDAVLDSRMSFVLEEGYWLYLFFFVSGYLVSKSRVQTVFEVIVKSVNRFFRLAFPVLFSCLIIYGIYSAIGFQNSHTAGIFQCDWFQNAYPGQYSFMYVLASPVDVLLLGNCFLNSPYWVLKQMLIASVLIYVLKYFHFILSKKNEAVCFSILVAAAFAFAIVSPIITACLIGMLISIYEETDDILKKPYFYFWAIAAAMTQYAFSDSFVFNLFFAFLILFVPKTKILNDVLSLKPVQFLGNISWGIYTFHWPLMCSLGAILLIALHPQMGLVKSYVFTCALIIITTLILSVAFYFTFERLASYLSKKIDICLRKLVSGLSLTKSL